MTTTPAATGTIDSFTWDLPYGEPTSLDPINAYNYSENTVLSNICEGLLRQTPDRKIVPALAESVTQSDPKTWVYKIRSGVKFFDGTPLTASDVVVNLRRHTVEATGSYYYSSFGNQIASVTQRGADQVVVTTKSPNTLVNQMMATGLGTIVEPKSISSQGAKFGTSSGTLNCTGPFELNSWKPGDSITLKANPSYWDASLTPKAASVKFVFVTDQSALANSLTAGEIDGTYEAPLSATEQLQKSSTGKFYLGVSTQGLSIYPFGNAVTNNLGVRQALYAAIDRVGIAKTAYSSTALAVKSLASPDAAPYAPDVFSTYYASLAEPGPDINKASALVKQVGSVGTIRAAILGGDPASLLTANSIQDSARKAGLHIQIIQVPAAQFAGLYYDGANDKKNYDVMITTTYYDVPDLLEFYGNTVLPGVVTNISNYNNDVVNNAYAKAVSLPDGTARAQATVELATQLDKDLPYLPLLRLNERLYMNNRIAGAPATFPYMYYPWAATIGKGSS